MKKFRIKAAGLLLLAIILTAGLNAQPYRHGGGPYARGMQRDSIRPMIMDRLDLTADQQSAMKELRTAHFNTMKPLRAKLAELRARERTLLAQEEVDMKAVNALIDEQTELMNQMKKLRVEHQLAVQNILTDEQQMMLEQMRMRRDHFRSNGNGRRGSPRWDRSYRRNMG
ncbi:MAG: Spy/CpxP family protein refolding chaperone [Bacteroidales bacterium]